MPAFSKNSQMTQTSKVEEDATRFRSRSRGDSSGSQGQVMCVRSSGSRDAGSSNDQACAIVRSSGEKKDDENPIPFEVLEEGEETCMEILNANMILHDIAQIMKLISDRMEAKQKRDQLAQGQVGGDGEIHVVEENGDDGSTSSYDSQETLILGETRHARRH